MKSKRKNISIKSKLIRIQMLLALIILVAQSLAFFLNDLHIFKRSIERTLESTAKILSRNLAPALAFSDGAEATKILSSLQSEPSIASAYLFDGKGNLFAKYGYDTAVESGLAPNTRHGSRIRGSHLVYYYDFLQGPEGQGTLRLDADLKVFTAEYHGYLWIVVALFLGGALVSYGLAHVIQRSLSEPIIELAATTTEISILQDYSLRMGRKGPGTGIKEMETLSTEFNHMLSQIQANGEKIRAANADLERKVELRTAELKEIQNLALENAHKAGMSEIATGVLHNIGNIINSVNTSAEEILQITQKSKIANLLKANRLLSDNFARVTEFLTEDPKGKVLPEYYLKIGESLKTEHLQLKDEVLDMMKKLSLIKDVVQTQQEYAKRGLFVEEISLEQVTDEILNLQQSALKRHGIELVRVYGDAGKIKVQRVKFAHVLMNLIKNSKEAMTPLPDGRKRLTVEIGAITGSGPFLRIIDTGEGISKTNLERIFSHGFTTKEHGHGFGLHFCANAMTEMGGKLIAESSGEGQGAAFTLTFSPIEELKGANCA